LSLEDSYRLDDLLAGLELHSLLIGIPGFSPPQTSGIHPPW
jgi:hypothetical protein